MVFRTELERSNVVNVEQISFPKSVFSSIPNLRQLAYKLLHPTHAIHPSEHQVIIPGNRTKLIDARPLTQELRFENEARSLIEFLLDRHEHKSEIIELIKVDKTVSETVRQKVYDLLDDYFTES